MIPKTVHAAIAEGNDPQVEARHCLMNYHNTPHPSTGKTSSELMMGRLLQTFPRLFSVHNTVRLSHHETINLLHYKVTTLVKLTRGNKLRQRKRQTDKRRT